MQRRWSTNTLNVNALPNVLSEDSKEREIYKRLEKLQQKTTGSQTSTDDINITTQNIEIRDLEERFRRLTESNEQKFSSSNPFNEIINEDKNSEPLCSFTKVFVDNNPILERYLAEEATKTSSNIEAAAMSSIDLNYNVSLRFQLEEYGESVLKQAAQLATNMLETFQSNSIPEPFINKKISNMVSYMHDPLIQLPEDYSYISDIHATLFEWINSLNNTSYENLVFLLNHLNQEQVTLNSKVLIAFVAGMLVPRVASALTTMHRDILTRNRLTKYDINVFIYDAIINTPNYKNFIIRLEESRELKEIIIEKNLLKKQEKSVSSEEKEKTETNIKKVKEVEERKKHFARLIRASYIIVGGVATLVIIYQGLKYVYTCKIIEKQYSCELTKERENFNRQRQVNLLQDQISKLETNIEDAKLSNKDLIINEPIIKILIIKFKNLFD